jgi:hypothetical protein
MRVKMISFGACDVEGAEGTAGTATGICPARLPDALDTLFTRTIDGVEFDIRRSGALEKLRLCEGLSRYQGHSDLHRAMRLAQHRAPGPVALSEVRFVA